VICLNEALAEYVAALVAAAPTPEQRARLAVLLRSVPRTPGLRAPRPVASAGSASHGFSAGARPHPTRTSPQPTTQAQRGALPRPGFGATPRAST